MMSGMKKIQLKEQCLCSEIFFFRLQWVTFLKLKSFVTLNLFILKVRHAVTQILSLLQVKSSRNTAV